MDANSILIQSQTSVGRCEMINDESLHFLCITLLSNDEPGDLSVVRGLRNACAGNERNAEYLIRMNVLQWITKFCRETALMKTNLDDDADEMESHSKNSDHSNALFILALCQLLSNFAACGLSSAQFLWSASFGETGE
jgi:hypothetical protein